MGLVKINMLSSATKVSGQGVGSAYLELVNLLEKKKDVLDVKINSKKRAFDIYHHHTVNYYFSFKKNGIHIVYVHFLPQTLKGSIKLNKLFFKIFTSYVKKYYQKADELVVVNPSFINELCSFGIPREKISYIPNFVSNAGFYKLCDDEISFLFEKYDIPKNSFVVLGVGQVQTRKGVLDFIDIANKNKDMLFLWAGGFSFGHITDGYKELKEIVQNPPSNVRFLGMIDRDEMNEIYNICDCFFSPSYNELFPMAILEAASVNKPCLLRNLDLYKDVLFDNCEYADSNEEFSFLLKEISINKNKREELIEKSKKLTNFYSEKYVLDLWVKYYQEIVEKYKKDSF